MRALPSRLMLLLVLLTAVSASHAHSPGLSQAVWHQGGSGPRLELTLARDELVLLAPETDADGDGRLHEDEFERGRARFDVPFAQGIDVAAGTHHCATRIESLRAVASEGVVVEFGFDCDPAAEAFQVDVPLLARLSPGHRQLLAIGDTPPLRALSAQASRFELARVALRPAPRVRAYAQVVALGAEHILFGWDHLAFLLGLMLASTRVRSLVGVLTAFTVAHSVTLAAAVFGWASTDATVIEVLIALSVAYVAAENLWWREQRERPRRWLLAFVFGLAHGFGFAGAVQSSAIPMDRVWPWLLSFNLGVELGQLLFALAGLHVLFLIARRTTWTPVLVPSTNVLLLLAGLGWSASRVGASL
jgi:hypothetical protein